MAGGRSGESAVPESAAAGDSQSDDLRSLAGGAGLTLVGRVCGRGAALLGNVAVARWLGPQVFGLYGIGWALVTFLYFLGPLGLDRGAVHFLARYREDQAARRRGVLLQSLGTSLATGGFFALLLFLSAGWLEESVFKAPGLAPIVRWFALLVPLASGLRVAAAATTARRTMKYSVVTEELIRPVGSLLLILLLLALGQGVQGAVAANVIATAAAFLVALAFGRRLFRESLRPGLRAPNLVRELLAFSLPASLAGVLTALTLRVDRLILGYFRPAAEVGSYLAAAQLTMVLALGASGFHAIFAPLVADLYHRQEPERLARLYRTATRWSFYVVSPYFLVCVLDGRGLLAAVFGAEFTAGAAAVVILAIMQLVCVLGGGSSYLLVMSGHQRYWAGLSAPAFVLNVALDLVLIPRFGLLGAAVATLVSLSALFLAGVLTAGRLLRLWPFTIALWKGIAALGVGAVVLAAGDRLLPPDGFLGLLLQLALASAAILGSLLLLRLEDDDRELLRILRARLSGRGDRPPDRSAASPD